MAQQKFDVVVIGSGIGGMTAAAMAAHKGYKTLVVEKLPFIGGRFSTREWKGFKLTSGAIGVEVGGVMEKTFKELGLDFDVRQEEGMRYRIGGQDFEMPKRGGLKALINIACGDEKEADRIYGLIRQGWKWQEPPGTLTFQEWLSQYTQNPKILGFFQGVLSAMLGGNIWELPAHAFIRFQTNMGGYRAFGVAPKGNTYLMNQLADVIRKNGGDVWTSAPARKVVVESGTAKGVVVQKKGQEVTVSAQAVISNAGPRRTIELIGSENLDRAYIKLVRDTYVPMSVMWLQIASDKPLLPYHGMLVPAEARRVNLINCPTNVAPELAPKGKSLLIVGAAPKSMTPPHDFKGELELALLDLKDIIPGFDNAEILMASWFSGDWPVLHTMPGHELPNKTNIENLWQVGDGAVPQGWAALPGSTLSGRLAVEDMERRLKPEA